MCSKRFERRLRSWEHKNSSYSKNVITLYTGQASLLEEASIKLFDHPSGVSNLTESCALFASFHSA
jgi:hypothetical protein